jgi:YHS domain-containing protein
MVKTAILTVIDPVCGMEVDPTRSPQSRNVKDQTYYFCSYFCAEIFDPEMTATELTTLRAAIWRRGHRARPRAILQTGNLTKRAIKKLLDSFGGES